MGYGQAGVSDDWLAACVYENRGDGKGFPLNFNKKKKLRGNDNNLTVLKSDLQTNLTAASSLLPLRYFSQSNP